MGAPAGSRNVAVVTTSNGTSTTFTGTNIAVTTPIGTTNTVAFTVN